MSSYPSFPPGSINLLPDREIEELLARIKAIEAGIKTIEAGIKTIEAAITAIEATGKVGVWGAKTLRALSTVYTPSTLENFQVVLEIQPGPPGSVVITVYVEGKAQFQTNTPQGAITFLTFTLKPSGTWECVYEAGEGIKELNLYSSYLPLGKQMP